MEEEKKVVPKKKKLYKIKKWGDSGFVGKIQFGCYDYSIKFLPEKDVARYINMPQDAKTYGAICCDDQTILVSSELTPQTQKLSLMHELVHMLLLNNNIGVCEETLNVQKEDLVDNLASRFLELAKRNPDLMRWLLK